MRYTSPAILHLALDFRRRRYDSSFFFCFVSGFSFFFFLVFLPFFFALVICHASLEFLNFSGPRRVATSGKDKKIMFTAYCKISCVRGLFCTLSGISFLTGIVVDAHAGRLFSFFSLTLSLSFSSSLSIYVHTCEKPN